MHIIIYNGGSLELPTFVYKLGEHLRKNGQEVTFMGKSASLFSFKKAGIRWYPLPYPQNNFQLFFKAWLVFLPLVLTKPLQLKSIFTTLKKDYRENHQIKGRKTYIFHFIQLGACKLINPDVIHNQWSPSLASLEPLFEHYPIIQSLHGILEDVKAFWNEEVASIYEKFFPKLAGVQAVSGETLKNASLFGAPTSNAIITHANVDSHLIDKARHSNFKIVRKSQLNIISVGNYVWRKGYIYALGAMKQLKDKSLNFHYKIIGSGDETQYRFHANDLGLNGFITLQNKTSHDQVIKEIKDADLFLLPSVQEGFGAVVSESMAVGTPVLTTDCCRKIEVLKNGVDSLIVPSMSSSSIAKGIEEFLAMSAHDEQEIISNAKLKVKKYLTYEINIPKYLNIYKKALS